MTTGSSRFLRPLSAYEQLGVYRNCLKQPIPCNFQNHTLNGPAVRE